MKLAAHPLVVAAALGLLGPAALDEVERERAPQEHKAEADLDEGPDFSVRDLFVLTDED